VLEEGLPEGNDTLLGSGAGTLRITIKRVSKANRTRERETHLDENEVVLDDTVTNETTDGGDSLLGNVELGGSRSLIVSLSNSVDLLVDPEEKRKNRVRKPFRKRRVGESVIVTQFGGGNRLDRHEPQRT